MVKYGFPIGHATEDAAPGTWMHTHNVKTNLEGEMEYTYTPSLTFPEKVEPETFQGFRRNDGRAAVRNEIWILPTVGCVNDVAKKMVRDNQDLVTGTIDGLYTFPIPSDAARPARTTPRPASFWQPWPATPTRRRCWC